MQEKKSKQNKRKEYSAPKLAKMGEFKKSTGWQQGRGFEVLFFLPRMI
ncbi:keywimysin-related RiPP [Actinorugispora endophytica]|uniref:Uncharacterized protein n=1 Tax=Actinorugispora endophytica TaxID=1605990 RepID=A0A4R6UT35_9ACTN|nr:keywimysin-related RiPP [Actinorugispora endophytica]TDQ48495.1 hypothetical protein EV190_11831 [Actinorugispora endophytica]